MDAIPGVTTNTNSISQGWDIVYILTLLWFSLLLCATGFLNSGAYYFKSKKDVSLRYIVPALVPVVCIYIYDSSIFFFSVFILIILFLTSQSIRFLVAQTLITCSEEDSVRYHSPPIESLLIIKAFCLCLLSAQVVYPFVGALPDNVIKLMEPSTSNYSKDSHFSINRRFINCSYENYEKPSRCSKYKSANYQYDKENFLYFTLFPVVQNEHKKWIILVTILLMILYFLEYEWINRPFINQRETKSVDSGPRSANSSQHPLDDYWVEGERCRDSKYDTTSAFRNFESVTFPHLLSYLWMPSIIVRINLGFNSLDHRDVIHSMLYGLRSEYKSQFVGIKTRYGIVSFVFKCVFIATITSLLSNAYIDFPDISKIRNLEKIMTFDGNNQKHDLKNDEYYNIDYCQILAIYSKEGVKEKEVSQFNKNLCNFSKKWALKVIPIIFSEVMRINVSNSMKPKDKSEHAVFMFVHFNFGLPKYNSKMALVQDSSLSLRLYHILVFIFLLWIVNSFLRFFPLIPYEKTLRSIDSLIDSLNKNKTEKKSTGQFTPSFWFRKAFSEESEYEVSRDRTDPRTVELAFMSLLDEIQNSSENSPLSKILKISIPTPELHFVFDELDKITGTLNPEKHTSELLDGNHYSFRFERQRAVALHELLSDMKRIISSSPARFIFVGGRMLHDEWMADQGRRQPLLTSIFDAEIYLPSLMLDLPTNQYSESLNLENVRDRKLTSRVREYFVRTHASSESLYQEVNFSRDAPFYGLKRSGFETANFFDDFYNEKTDLNNINVVDWNHHWELKADKKKYTPDEDLKLYLINDYVRFLTYRSVGSPKKMLEILSSSIRPVTRFTNSEVPHSKVSEILPCKDVLVFKEIDIYRIQFIASLFRHIEENFEEKLLSRDDKISVNIIYLFDFLLKFHGRAFTWSSLEKLDELAHIHHVPDLRRLLESIVDKSSNDYLYTLLNGLYSFRFRSEFVVEIRYLSRHSEQEMAAFNFTLDESQDLKKTYTAMLNSSGELNEDIITSLGELHEYDQAYDLARGYYEIALKINDKNFSSYVGDKVDISDGVHEKIEEILRQEPKDLSQRDLATLLSNYNPPAQVPYLKAILMQDKEGIKNSSYFVPWIIRRIRLMLQIGMTFEQAKDLERAQTYYHASNLFVRSLFDYAFTLQNNISVGTRDTTLIIQLIKQMNVLFQPVFAEAWVSEKLEGSIDTSLSLIENYLFYLRKNLPFLKNFNVTDSKEISDEVTNSNFSLIGVEMHNKAGDLYFFKGKEGVYFDDDENFIGEIYNPKKELIINNGYLYNSHYHYAMSLQELRRYIVYRMETSKFRFGIFNKKTQSSSFLPSFVNSAISNSLIDFSQCSIARTSLFKVLKQIKISNEDEPIIKLIKTTDNENTVHRSFKKIFSFWIQSPDSDEKSIFLKIKKEKNILSEELLSKIVPSYINYFGRWNISKKLKKAYKSGNKNKISNPKFLKFSSFDNEIEQLIFSLYSAVLGADYSTYLGQNNRSSAGYRMILIFVNSYLKSHRIISLLGLDVFSHHFSQSKYLFCDLNVYEFLYKIISIANLAIQKCDNLRKQKIPPQNKYKIGSVIPVELASATCELQFNIHQCSNDLILLQQKTQDERVRTKVGSLLGKFNAISDCLEQTSCDWFGGSIDNKPKYIDEFDFHKSKTQDGQRSNIISRSRLIYIQTRHKFPVLAGLSTLKSIVDEEMFGMIYSTRESIHDKYLLRRFFESLDWLEEMCERANSLNAPQHFTPLMQAESLSLASLAIHRFINLDCSNEIDLSSLFDDKEEIKKITNHQKRIKSELKVSFYKLAHIQLRESEESFSQGAKYYKSISDLYYLFDDFNDRQLHANHAIQMGKSDIISLLRAYLQVID